MVMIIGVIWGDSDGWSRVKDLLHSTVFFSVFYIYNTGAFVLTFTDSISCLDVVPKDV